MGGGGDAKVAAKRGRRDAGVMVWDLQDVRIGDRSKEIAHKNVEFCIGDEMSGLLMTKGSAQNSGEAEQRIASAGEADRSVAGTDQLALDTKRGRLERHESYAFESDALNRRTKHECLSRELNREDQGK